MLRILYLSSGHLTLEADDLLSLNRLTLQWFSTGCDEVQAHMFRSGYNYVLPVSEIQNEIYPLYKQCGTRKPYDGEEVYNHGWQLVQLTPEIVDQFDVIFVSFFVYNITHNWDLLKNKRVILRTYGMHPIQWEIEINRLKRMGVYVARMAPNEHLRADLPTQGDVLLRHGVVSDENEVSGWIGDEKVCVTFVNSFNDSYCQSQYRKKLYEQVMKISPYSYEIHGEDNDPLSHTDKLERMRHAKVAICTGTPNSNLTYSFVESWVMGIPMVVFGRNMWQGVLCEADNLISNGKDGFVAYTPDEVAGYVQLLMNDEKMARMISKAGRAKAISLFGREKAAITWKDLLCQVCTRGKSY